MSLRFVRRALKERERKKITKKTNNPRWAARRPNRPPSGRKPRGQSGFQFKSGELNQRSVMTNSGRDKVMFSTITGGVVRLATAASDERADNLAR